MPESRRRGESFALTREYFGGGPEHELSATAAALHALALTSDDRPREAVVELLRALIPTLPLYRRSLTAYTDDFERGER